MRNSVRNKAKPRGRPSLPTGDALNRKLFSIELGAFLLLCEDFNTPRSLACYLLAKAGEWQQYLDLPRAYFDDDFPTNHGITEIMRKNPRLPLKVDRATAAIQTFLGSEEHCREVNNRFWSYPINGPYGPADMSNLVVMTKDIIRETLGRLTSARLMYAESRFRFGPGATTDVSGKKVLLSRKMMPIPYGITPRLVPFASGFLWPGASLKKHIYSKVTTVPKTVLTDRTIAIEPHLNIYVQLGIGALIRQRLERSGLQCSTQEHNRQAAMIAHKANLATIDLSSASDTVSAALVQTLLPSDWFELLYVARTDYSLLPGEVHPRELEKFSSMGNGFTWELETLIFWSLARAVARVKGVDEYSTLAFGDDIIIPSSCVELMMEALNHFGFKVNGKKSFWQGDFFESCGVDVFRGRDVRPCYFKGDYHDVETATIRIANALRRHAHRLGGRYCCDRRFLRAYRFVVRHGTVSRQTGIPEGFGDEGLIKNFDEARPSRARRGWEGWRCKVLHRKPLQSRLTDPLGAYTAALCFGAYEHTRSTEYERGATAGPQLRTIPVMRWYDLGPWA